MGYLALPFLPFTDHEVFKVVNAALPAWLLLALLPRWKLTIPIATATALFFSVLYTALMANTMFFNPPSTPIAIEAFGSLQGLQDMFKVGEVVLPAWVHYIAFDLWVGRWEVLDAKARGIPQLLMLPVPFFTLMFGPVGLLLYWLVALFYPVQAERLKRQ